MPALLHPVDAYPSGRSSDNPLGIPNNLFPYVSQIAVGRRAQLQVFSGDCPTPDATGVHDTNHVMDLVEGHRAALNCLLAEEPQLLHSTWAAANDSPSWTWCTGVGGGIGCWTLNIFTVRRPRDAAISVADPTKAAERLGWRTQRSLDEICRDGWAWQQQNPEGYA